MKSRKSGFAVIAVLGASLLFVSIPGCQGSQRAFDQPKSQVLDQTKISGNVRDEAKKSLAQQIISDFRTMEELFKAKEFHCLAKLMGKRGTSLVTVGFEKIPGAASAEYWRSLWKEGAELKLVPVNVFVHNLRDRALVPYCTVMDEGVSYEQWKKNPVYYDAMAVVSFEYEITGQKAGESTGDVEDPVGTMLLLHKSGCPWG